jgi:hypothetical protein
LVFGFSLLLLPNFQFVYSSFFQSKPSYSFFPTGSSSISIGVVNYTFLNFKVSSFSFSGFGFVSSLIWVSNTIFNFQVLNSTNLNLLFLKFVFLVNFVNWVSSIFCFFYGLFWLLNWVKLKLLFIFFINCACLVHFVSWVSSILCFFFCHGLFGY